MKSFRFGHDDLSLYGSFHAAQQSNLPIQPAVLLCNPLGQESVRLHRFYRVLAERLSRLGIAVLRFDYYATGESAGEEVEGRLARWCDDVLEAHRELIRLSGAKKISWIGARLGGSIALQAATRLSGSLDRLILWEPVLDGPAYLAELAQDHARAVARPGLSLHPQASARPDEALGFAMSQGLIDDIAQINARVLTRATPVRTTWVIGQPDDTDLAATVQAAQATQPTLKHQALSVPFAWTSEEALNTSLVPPAALQALSQLMEDARS